MPTFQMPSWNETWRLRIWDHTNTLRYEVLAPSESTGRSKQRIYLARLFGCDRDDTPLLEQEYGWSVELKQERTRT